MSLPTLIKTEFWGGPKDGDKQPVAQRERGVAYEARDPNEVHVYVYDRERARMQYMGLFERSLVGVVLPLKIGDRSGGV